MNDIIKNQLKGVKYANIPPFDDNTTELIIEKIRPESINTELQIDHCYIIELADYIINPPPGFDLHINWNKNIIPKNKYMKCIITNIMGKMIKLDGIGFNLEKFEDIDIPWSGWCPSKAISIIKKLD